MMLYKSETSDKANFFCMYKLLWEIFRLNFISLVAWVTFWINQLEKNPELHWNYKTPYKFVVVTQERILY